MPSILMIIPPSNFRDEELFQPKEIFETNGFKVVIASTIATKARGMLGSVVNVEFGVDNIATAYIPNKYEAVVFVGGAGVEQNKMYENERVLAIARAAVQCKALAAICLAPMILAAAGILKGKQATVYASGAQFLRNHGAEYTTEPIIEDGNIITASGPAYAESFGELVVDTIKSAPAKERE